MAQSIVKQKSYDFALKIIKFCAMLRNQKHFEISSQLLRSGTSIGANVEEALAGRSRKDFFAKMSIASKEARESYYWLRLLKESQLANIGVDDQIEDIRNIINVLTAIVKTTRQSLKG
ncbi:MAG: four helix bundle protein [Bacteroidetes bacterium]|nr:MAG: four helix bundle protein [Bacteroidota bacterium]